MTNTSHRKVKTFLYEYPLHCVLLATQKKTKQNKTKKNHKTKQKTKTKTTTKKKTAAILG
jgi:hypothetical protein